MAPFFFGWCIRDLGLCDCATLGGEWEENLPSCADNTFYQCVFFGRVFA